MKDTEQHAWLSTPEGHAHVKTWTGDSGRLVVSPWPHLLVAQCIAMHCGLDGSARPGIPTIAAHAHRSERQVRESIGILERSGYLQVDRKRGSGNRYRVMYPPSAPQSLTNPAHLDRADKCADDRADKCADDRADDRADSPHESGAEGEGSKEKGGGGRERVDAAVAAIATGSVLPDPTHGNRHPPGNPENRACRQCGKDRKAAEAIAAGQTRAAQLQPFDPDKHCECGSAYTSVAAAGCPDAGKHRRQAA